MEKPFVHLMETPKNKYAFDVNSNQIPDSAKFTLEKYSILGYIKLRIKHF